METLAISFFLKLAFFRYLNCDGKTVIKPFLSEDMNCRGGQEQQRQGKSCGCR